MDNNNQPLIYMLSSIYNLLPVRLDDSNYITWLFQMKNMLKSLGLEGYVDGSYSSPPQFLVTNGSINAGVTREFQEWEKNDKALMTLITATLSSEALSFVVGSNTSCEVWKNLRVRYGVSSRTAAMQLQTNLYTIQKGNDTIDKYFQRIKNITDQLASVGIHIPEEEIVIIAVNGLPSEYMTIKIVVKALITTMSMHKLRSLLLDEESTMDQSTKTMQNGMPTVTNSSVISGMPTFNHYNTPIASSAAINVPNATWSCQDMIPLSTNFGASQTMPNSGYMLNNNVGNGSYFSAPTLPYGYAPQTDGFMLQNGTFVTQNEGFMAQNGGHTRASQPNYSQQGLSQNNVSQQLSQQHGSVSQASTNNSKIDPTAMVAHNSFNNFEVTLLHSSSSHLDSVAPIDAQRFPTSKMEIKLESSGESFTIADESGKDPVHDVGSQIVVVPSKDGILYAQEDSDHKEPMVLSRDGHELSQSTILESALQPRTNAATRNGFSEIENDKGSKLEVLSRFELSPNIVGKGGSKKQNSESPRLAENVCNRLNASTEQAEAQPQLAYGRETMELLSKSLMNCRQYCQPMQLWPSLPLIPPG